MKTLFEEKVASSTSLTDEQKETLISVSLRLPETTIAFLVQQLDTDPESMVMFVESLQKKREALIQGDIAALDSILEEELEQLED